MTALEVVVGYLDAFCAGDLARVAERLGEPFELRGPLYAFDSRDAYLDSLRADPPVPAAYRLVEVIGTAERAAILYDYVKPDSTVRVAQWFELRDGRICRTRLAFSLPGADD